MEKISGSNPENKLLWFIIFVKTLRESGVIRMLVLVQRQIRMENSHFRNIFFVLFKEGCPSVSPLTCYDPQRLNWFSVYEKCIWTTKKTFLVNNISILTISKFASGKIHLVFYKNHFDLDRMTVLLYWSEKLQQS